MYLFNWRGTFSTPRANNFPETRLPKQQENFKELLIDLSTKEKKIEHEF